MCPPMWPHWRHLANVIELMLLSVHPSPQPKRQIDWFRHLCCSRQKVPVLYNEQPFPQNCPFSLGIWTSIWFMIPWAIPRSQSKQHDDRFSRFCTGDRTVSYTLQWGAPFPPQNCPFSWGICTAHLIHGSLGPPESSTQTADQFSCFCRAHYCDRQTNRQTTLLDL